MNALDITPAYDYENQRWVEGPAAIPLRRAQLQADLDMLSGERGDEYAAFVGIADVAAARDRLRHLLFILG